jgi:hypothetical protein
LTKKIRGRKSRATVPLTGNWRMINRWIICLLLVNFYCIQPACIIFLAPLLRLLAGDDLTHVLNNKTPRLLFSEHSGYG